MNNAAKSPISPALVSRLLGGHALREEKRTQNP